MAAAAVGILSLSPVAGHHGGAAVTNEGYSVRLINPANGLPPGWTWSPVSDVALIPPAVLVR